MKSFLRRILPVHRRRAIRQFLQRLDVGWLKLVSRPVCAGSAVVANLYYGVVNSQFSREHMAVIAGRSAYLQGRGLANVSAPLLRRNIHRIEKGLSMQPRKAVFAEAFIGETVAAFNWLNQQTNGCASELKWAQDVLERYFEVVTHSAPIAAARAAFIAMDSHPDTSIAGPYVPYSHAQKVQSGINYSQFLSLCQQRRSVRWYTTEPVPDESLNLAIEAASQAPSACNRQAFHFYVANDPNLAPQIASFAGGTAGFAQQVPCTVVLVGDLSAYSDERDRHLIYIDGSLAAMQLMLALESLGLGSCSINWPDLEVPEAQMAKRLGLSPWERPIMLIAVGYAQESGLIPYSQKKPVSLLRKDILS